MKNQNSQPMAFQNSTASSLNSPDKTSPPNSHLIDNTTTTSPSQEYQNTSTPAASSAMTALSVTEILNTINRFGGVAGLSEEELNAFRQQVLSLGINADSKNENTAKNNMERMDQKMFNANSNYDNDQKQDQLSAPQQNIFADTKTLNSSKRSGVFNRRGIGTTTSQDQESHKPWSLQALDESTKSYTSKQYQDWKNGGIPEMDLLSWQLEPGAEGSSSNEFAYPGQKHVYSRAVSLSSSSSTPNSPTTATSPNLMAKSQSMLQSFMVSRSNDSAASALASTVSTPTATTSFSALPSHVSASTAPSPKAFPPIHALSRKPSSVSASPIYSSSSGSPESPNSVASNETVTFRKEDKKTKDKGKGKARKKSTKGGISKDVLVKGMGVSVSKLNIDASSTLSTAVPSPQQSSDEGSASPINTTAAPTTTSDDSKAFQCNQCSLSFRRNHDLKRHVKIHLPIRPYVCELCRKGFNRKDALRRHLLSNACKMSPMRRSIDGSNSSSSLSSSGPAAAAAAIALQASSSSSGSNSSTSSSSSTGLSQVAENPGTSTSPSSFISLDTGNNNSNLAAPTFTGNVNNGQLGSPYFNNPFYLNESNEESPDSSASSYLNSLLRGSREKENEHTAVSPTSTMQSPALTAQEESQPQNQVDPEIAELYINVGTLLGKLLQKQRQQQHQVQENSPFPPPPALPRQQDPNSNFIPLLERVLEAQNSIARAISLNPSQQLNSIGNNFDHDIPNASSAPLTPSASVSEFEFRNPSHNHTANTLVDDRASSPSHSYHNLSQHLYESLQPRKKNRVQSPQKRRATVGAVNPTIAPPLSSSSTSSGHGSNGLISSVGNSPLSTSTTISSAPSSAPPSRQPPNDIYSSSSSYIDGTHTQSLGMTSYLNSINHQLKQLQKGSQHLQKQSQQQIQPQIQQAQNQSQMNNVEFEAKDIEMEPYTNNDFTNLLSLASTFNNEDNNLNMNSNVLSSLANNNRLSDLENISSANADSVINSIINNFSTSNSNNNYTSLANLTNRANMANISSNSIKGLSNHASPNLNVQSTAPNSHIIPNLQSSAQKPPQHDKSGLVGDEDTFMQTL